MHFNYIFTLFILLPCISQICGSKISKRRCKCNFYGSLSPQCEPITGQCPCKPGVRGMNCDSCIQTNMVLGPDGCESETNEDLQQVQSRVQEIDMNVESERLNKCPTCDQRYFKHYLAQNCQPIHEDGCECPSRFDCTQEELGNPNVCFYQDKFYFNGDEIPTSNPCEICSCQQDLNYKTYVMTINCIGIECFSDFESNLLKPGCHEVFEEGKCCPTDIKCEDGNSTETDEKTCLFEGKTYHLGQQIYSDEDPCLTCLCDENFEGKTSSSCRQAECNLDKDIKSFQDGCVPIYHEKTCCPIEIYCPTGNERKVLNSLSLNTSDSEHSEHQCKFGEKSYNIGDEIDIKHPTNCVHCSCSTPPDITCVHKTCERPPNNDYENCQSIFVPGQCCATYKCNLPSAPVKVCDPVHCTGNCVEAYIPGGCPVCRCDDILCSPPKCEPECEINYDVEPGSCPFCKCPERIEQPKICEPIRCGPQCFEGLNSQGCPMCVCGPLCSPPKCDEGCHVQTNFSEGQCPGCECPEDLQSLLPKVMCAPVKCPPMCDMVPGDYGCPTCKCDVLCSPPKCMPGCRMEAYPYSGPCPGCVCDHDKTSSDLQCLPVLCQPGCSEVLVPNGCPMCKCDQILCSIPKCEEGCTVETEFPPSGGCPGCKCPPSMPLDRPQCAPVKCSSQCYEGTSPQGCPMCVCGPICDPPKCASNCEIQTDVPPGQCPGCVCRKVSRTIPKHNTLILDKTLSCSPVLCPPSCQKTIAENGCEECICEPECSPPKCEPGCKIESDPVPGRCQGCVCDSVLPPQIACFPVKCKPGCEHKLDKSKGPCPYCDCEPEPENTDQQIFSEIACSIPKCEPGCSPKLISGPCPSCHCEDKNDVKKIPRVMCSPPRCRPGCYPKIRDGACPTCLCESDLKTIPPTILCSPPKCEPGCYPKLQGGPCPSCYCGDNSKLIPPMVRCRPPKCEPGCYLKKQNGPCPSCFCENDESKVIPLTVMCSPPRCDPGCYPKFQGGPCPSCYCGDNSKQIPPTIMCTPPKCEPGCYPKIQNGPCPSCFCGDEERVIPRTIRCRPPKCDPGCYPKFQGGPCPSCFCEDSSDGLRIPQEIQCSIPRCEPGCHVSSEFPEGGCPKCICSDEKMYRTIPKIQCSIPRCNAGCYPKIIPPNRCASCYCPEGGIVGGLECPQMACELPCRKEKLTPNSCPMCICDNYRSFCANPKCDDPGCFKEPTPDGCYECVCVKENENIELPSRIKPQVQCSPVYCPPTCEEVTKFGCPSCECKPMCSLPRCNPGCLVMNKTRGPCPFCDC